MTRYPLKVLLAALAVETGSSFVTNNWSRAPSVGSLSIKPRGPLYSSPQEELPLDNNSVFTAYDEWRNKFGKGDFDAVRFANFESNFKVLTSANIKARDKALAEGREPPQWLELNEFGDYSREEYQAMKVAAQSSTSALPLQTSEIKDVLGGEGTRPVRRTQVIKPPQQYETRDMTPIASNQDSTRSSPIPLKSDMSEVVQSLKRPAAAKKGFVSKTSINELYGPPKNYENSGDIPTEITKNEVLTQATQVNSKASISELYGPPSSSTSLVDDPTDTQNSSFGTQVFQKKETPVQGTKFTSRPSSINELYGPPPSFSNETPDDSYGTPVIQKSATPSRGTQVIPSASSINELYGPPSSLGGSNELPNLSMGTQVISTAASINELYSPPSSPSSFNETPSASWGTQVIRKNENPVQGTQVISKASVNELYGPPPSSTTSPNEAPSSSWGTQVIKKNENPGQGTQVISKASVNELYGPPSSSSEPTETTSASWGTQVIRKNDNPGRGTQVISRASVNELYGPPSSPTSSNQTPGTSWGTQVIRKNENQPRGTQVISRAPVDDPYRTPGSAINPNQSPNTSWGTQVIRKNENPTRGTQVISRATVDETYGSSGSYTGSPEIRGTQVIRKADQPTSWGTQVIQKAGDQPPPRGTQVLRRAADALPDQGTQPIRGTQVIPRGEVAGQQGLGTQDDANRGTYVITPGAIPRADTNNQSWNWDTTAAVPQETTMQSYSAPNAGNPNPFGGRDGNANSSAESMGGVDTFKKKSSIFSFFGGSKVAEEPPEAVSGTVVVQGDDKTEPENSSSEGRPQTVLVNKADMQNIVPSIFSFFGGAKKSEIDNELKTEEPATNTMQAAKPKQQTRPTLVIDKNSVDFPRNKVLPELRRWWQNADGSITGYIYNSQNFNDGTKLTTSPLQRAACRSGNVVRSGGKDFLLM